MMATDWHRSSTRSIWWLENNTPRPGRGLVDEHGADGVDPDGVETREGFVEHEELGLVDEGGGELHPLLVAERQRLELARGAVGHAELLEPLHGGASRASAASTPCSRARYSICSTITIPG